MALSIPATQKRPRDDQVKGEEDGAPVVCQAPHTLRLLKLIEQGTTEHAQLAATQLRQVTKEASSLILWDILGRLQEFLVSPAWNTRYNASVAMEGVARRLPPHDQQAFLQQTVRGISLQESNWLTLTLLQENVDIILQNGRHLLASAETKFNEEEERELLNLDQTFSHTQTFLDDRIKLQRQILARRLGFSAVLMYMGSAKGVHQAFSDQDLVPKRLRTSETNTSVVPPAPSQDLDSSSTIRTLLLAELYKTSGNAPTSSPVGASETQSHRSPQTLLATELVFRMFDASWHVRHGSLLGILALVRAWASTRGISSENQPDNHFGSWPHDILVRSLCVLMLDRFADFSETPTSSHSGGLVAPVREMAGQVVATLYFMAPLEIQNRCIQLMEQLVADNDSPVDWEVQHGVLLALKYVVALIQSSSVSCDSTFCCHIVNIVHISMGRHSHEIRGTAAQLTMELLKVQPSCQNTDTTKIVEPFWVALQTMDMMSSSVKDLVALLAFWVQHDFAMFVKHLSPGLSMVDGATRIVGQLSKLMECSYASVQNTVLMTVGIVADQLSRSITTESLIPSADLGDSFCDMVQTVFNSFLSHVIQLDDDSTSEYDIFQEIYRKSWESLTKSSENMLKTFPDKREALERNLIMTFFGFCHKGGSNASGMSFVNTSMLRTSFGQQHAIRRETASSLGSFLLARGHRTGDNTTVVLELCLAISIKSPFVAPFELACMLLEALGSDFIEVSLWNHTVLRDNLLGYLAHPPPCLKLDYHKLRAELVALQKLWTTTFSIGFEYLGNHSGEVVPAIEAVDIILRRATQSYSLDETTPSVTLDSMRLSVLAAGAIISGGRSWLPDKLTPIIRSLMTSIRNETDHNCLASTSQCMVKLMKLLLDIATSTTQSEGYIRTRFKVLQNMRSLVEEGSDGASVAVGVLVNEFETTGLSLHLLEPLWECVQRLADWNNSRAVGTGVLLVVRSLCVGLHRHQSETSIVMTMVLDAVVKIHCISDDQLQREISMLCVKELCTKDEANALSIILPCLRSFLVNSNSAGERIRACQLLNHILDVCAMHICPFVRALLPISMSLLKDPVQECSNAAASIFSRLVQFAPLVEKSVSLSLGGDGITSSSELVMDHLIQGKPLPAYEIPQSVLSALEGNGFSLRTYQFEGIAWLRFLYSVHLGGALTDAMGLGKTLQTLVGIAVAHVECKDDKHPRSLIVCPTSVVGHWMNEITRFFQGSSVFRPYCIGGGGNTISRHWDAAMKENNIFVTSYAVLRSEIQRLSGPTWHYCVLDEGHMLKNPKTLTAQASRKLLASHKVVLTGTPVQNKVEEVWAIFDWLMPNFLGTSKEFTKEYAGPIRKGQADGASASEIADGMDRLKLLHQQVLPFVLRREKEQVLNDLPPKCVTVVPCEMSDIQSGMYKRLCASDVAKKSLDALERSLRKPSGFSDQSRPTIGADALKTMLYLRLLCTHPALAQPQQQRSISSFTLEASGKLVALKDCLRASGLDCADLAAADNDSSLLYITSEGDQAEDRSEMSEVLEVDSCCNPKQMSFGTTSNGGSKCLIFAQFSSSLDVVQELVLKRFFPSVRFLRLDGKVPPEKRADIVDSFNKDGTVKILLLTTRIGGLGLNLTGADTVIFLEHDWNPHSDLQAMDRAHRIGQEKRVNVYKLVTKDTLEEKIMKLHEVKMAMSEAIVNAENSTMYSMGTDRLLDIFRFRGSTADTSTGHVGDAELDALVERYGDEYVSLSLPDFIRGFQQEK
eukprot:Nitzschia sp. Nitz4//scaffold407_size10208//2481//7801//NITZ4_009081-RA/size10208-processed-gene-0.4-mRNA-1//1//CDS//3329551135//7859//frame0